MARALFETKRTNRADDTKLIQKSKIVNKATPTIKGGSSLLDRISEAQSLVNRKLGKFKDKFTLISFPVFYSEMILYSLIKL